jgi:hypothetical protein
MTHPSIIRSIDKDEPGLGHPEALEDLLDRVAAWPSIRIDRNGRRATLRDRIAGVIGNLDLRTASLVVDVPWDMVGALGDLAPPAPGEAGVRLEVLDEDRSRTAIALLRWRTEIERFAPQYRNASP